jgi:hypothetical protein
MEKNCILCGELIVTSEFDLKPMCVECARDYYNNDNKSPDDLIDYENLTIKK